MKKLIASLLACVLLAGCSSGNKPAEATSTPEASTEASVETTTEPSTSTTGLTIICPKGAPALALIPVLNGEEASNVTMVDGSDLLQAAFVNPSPEYDVIIAPSNLGAKLAASDKTTYKMLAVVTWGNLYVVGQSEDSLTEGNEFAAFGEGAVPGLVFDNTIASDISANVTYYNAVADAQAALLSGKANAALLAEPAATATIAKAKENGLELKIIADLQSEWGEDGYPQAALFVQADKYEADPASYNDLLEIIAKYLNGIEGTDYSQLSTDVDAIGADVLGIPSGAIAAKTFERMNVRVVTASSVMSQLTDFLKLFDINDLTNVVIE